MKNIKIVLLIMLFVLICFLSMSGARCIGIDQIKKFLIGFGILAPIVYIIFFALVPLTFFPDALLAISAGVVFGTVLGAIYTVIGALLGGSLAFYLSRRLSFSILDGKLDKYKQMHSLIEKRGFLIILFLRFIPLIPFDVISYASGATRVKYKDYILATFFGIIPGVIILVSLGDSVASTNQSKLYLSIVALILLLLFSPKLKKHAFSLGENIDI